MTQAHTRQLIAQREKLVAQLRDIDAMIILRPTLVQQLDDIETKIAEQWADQLPQPGAQRGRGRPPTYSLKTLALVGEMTSAGMTIRQISTQLGIHHNTIPAMQKRLGVRSMNKKGGARIAYVPEKVAEVQKLVAEGLTNNQIAKRTGIPRGSVHTLRNKAQP